MLWCRMLGLKERKWMKVTNYRNENVINDLWKTLRDGISNEAIRDKTGVEKIEELLRSRDCEGLSMWNWWMMRAPVKAKKFYSWRFKKKPTKEKMERDCTKRYADERVDSQDRSLWRLGCKNRLTPTCVQNKPGTKRNKKFVSALVINKWWWF